PLAAAPLSAAVPKTVEKFTSNSSPARLGPADKTVGQVGNLPAEGRLPTCPTVWSRSAKDPPAARKGWPGPFRAPACGRGPQLLQWGRREVLGGGAAMNKFFLGLGGALTGAFCGLVFSVL